MPVVQWGYVRRVISGLRSYLERESACLPLCCLAVAGWLCSAVIMAEEKVEPQVINVDAPTASSTLDKLVAQKNRDAELEKARADRKALGEKAPAELELRWRELEASGVLNGPELQVRATPKKWTGGNDVLRDPKKDFNVPLEGAANRAELSLPGGADRPEEPAAPNASKTKPASAAQKAHLGSDPESARLALEDPENLSAGKIPQNKIASKSIAAQKFVRGTEPDISRLSAEERDEREASGAPQLSALKAQTPSAKISARSPSGRALDAFPRLAAGDKLDQDELTPAKISAVAQTPASEIRSPLMLVENPAAAKTPQSAEAPLNPDYWKPQGVAHSSAQVKSRIPELPSKLPSLKGARDGPASASGQKKQEDPEVHMNQLLKEIAVLGERLKVLNQSEKERIAHSLDGDSNLNIRDERLLKAMSALRGDQSPGAVSVKVIEAQSKRPLIARVKLVDPTETTARSPLKDGFWCRGSTPGINVLPGLVKLEVNHGGRFSPTFVKGLNVKPGRIEPVEVTFSQVPQLDFAARGWMLADLDIGLRARPGENRVWFGAPPTLDDLILGAQAEGVRVVGLALPLENESGHEKLLAQIQAANARKDSDVLVLPVYPGPRHVFNGCASGLGVEHWDGLKSEIGAPELPLRDGFDLIRAQGGLAVFTDLAGGKMASVEKEILPLFKQLGNGNYFDSRVSKVRLYGASELPFDTITGGFDLFSFDGSDESEAVWFNLLNEGAPIQVIGAGGGSLEGGRIPFGQTFIQSHGKTTRGNVLAALQQGRTVVSFGPAVFCKILERDMGPGSVLPTDGRHLSLQIEAYSSLTQGAQLEKIEVLRNGKVFFEQKSLEGEAEINDLRCPISESANAWYVVRVTEKLNRGKQDSGERRRAWTSPIYFRGASFAAPRPALARVHGVVRKGLTPVRGSVTALALNEAPVRVQTDANGAYSIQVPAAGSLVFRADDCEPVALRVFEHERVQRALGHQMSADEPLKKLAERSIFGMWRLLLSDLEWDVTLQPEKDPQDAPKLPEPE